MKTGRNRSRLGMAGFTLVESIIVIVVTGILAAVVAIFIRAPVQGYFDSVRRAELSDQADVALRRITRDVRLALPNSLRVATVGNVNYIEFIMTRSGGRYRDTSDGSIGGDFLSFSDASDRSFDVHGPLPDMAVGDFIVIFNLGAGTADAYAGGNRASIAGIAGNNVTLTNNPFANQSPPLSSPNGRFQVVSANVQAVSYGCPAAAAGPVQRYVNYGFHAAQVPNATPPAVAPALLLAQGATCTVNYIPALGGRNGLLEIELTLTSGDETITLAQQIRVDNAP